MEMKVVQPGMHGWGLGQSEPCLCGTDVRMFPPPWNDCSWTVSALCPCRDRACLLQHSPRAENFLWLPALSFRKVPIQGARPLPLWLQPSVPGFLWDIWPHGITRASGCCLPSPMLHSPGLSPIPDQSFL